MTLGACGTDDEQPDISEDVASGEDTGEGDVGDDTAGEDTSVEDTVGEDTVGEDTSVEDTSVEDTVGEDAVGEDTSGEDTIGEDTTGEDTTGEDTVGEDTTVEDAGSDAGDTVGEDTVGADTVGADTVGEDTVGEDTSGEDAASDASIGPERLCRDSGGRWDVTACGHYSCGAPNECAAVIPGCDCGEDANFVEGVGCVDDPACSPLSDEELCELSDGAWDEGSCGHYVCGEFPDCDAVIPGCNCGEDANFFEGVGCVGDPVCGGGDGEQALCVSTGGVWDETSCGHYGCGMPPLCLAIIPGCNCGPGHNFDAEAGCVGDATCEFIEEETLCWVTGGDWEEFTCGPLICGEPRPETCFVPFPACNCGTERSWVGGAGCIADNDCDECPDASDPRGTYLSTDPEECALIDFLCDAGSYGFYGECGCGCYEALPRPPG